MNAIFKGKAYGAVTVGERGQVVLPADLRKDFHIKPGGKLMVFANEERRLVTLMTEKDFSAFLDRASKAIARLEGGVGARDDRTLRVLGRERRGTKKEVKR